MSRLPKGVKRLGGPIDYNIQYRKRKRWIDVIKQGYGCQHCGYREYSCALDFDHINRADKEFLIPRFLGRTTLKRLFKEIRKCQILCANCHRVHSQKQREQLGLAI